MFFNRRRQTEKPAVRAVELPFEVGEIVTNGTLVGRIESIGLSPYYAEEIHGVKRAYVIGLNGEFADYWLV